MNTASQPTLLDEGPSQSADLRRPVEIRPSDRGINLDEVLGWLGEIDRLDEDKYLGYVIRRATRDGTPEQMVLLLGAFRDRLRQ